MKPLIWALDIATVTGFARGRIGEKPVAQSVRLAPAASYHNVNDLFGGCVAWFGGLLKQELPDILMLEELLPPTARVGATSTRAQHRLAGLHGIVRGMARQAGIGEIVGANVLAVRQHFIHARNLPRADAKRAVASMCTMLGWEYADDNCSDALALWSYAAAVIDPRVGLQTTPLFGTWAEVARARQAKPRG